MGSILKWGIVLALLYVIADLFPFLLDILLFVFGIGYLGAKVLGYSKGEQFGCGILLVAVATLCFVIYIIYGACTKKEQSDGGNFYYQTPDTIITSTYINTELSEFDQGYYAGVDDGTHDGVIDVDKNGQIRYSSAAFGLSDEDLKDESDEYRKGYREGYEESYSIHQRKSQYDAFEAKREAARKKYEEELAAERMKPSIRQRSIPKPKILDQPNPYQ